MRARLIGVLAAGLLAGAIPALASGAGPSTATATVVTVTATGTRTATGRSPLKWVTPRAAVKALVHWADDP